MNFEAVDPRTFAVIWYSAVLVTIAAVWVIHKFGTKER
jgi:hypothetical protein